MRTRRLRWTGNIADGDLGLVGILGTLLLSYSCHNLLRACGVYVLPSRMLPITSLHLHEQVNQHASLQDYARALATSSVGLMTQFV